LEVAVSVAVSVAVAVAVSVSVAVAVSVSVAVSVAVAVFRLEMIDNRRRPACRQAGMIDGYLPAGRQG